MNSRAFVLAVALLALATAAHATPLYSTFLESAVGDAGRPGDPIHIGPEGVVYDAIAGTIGAGGDNSDAYLFYFAGGAFTALSSRPGDPINIYRPGDPITPFATSTLNGLDAGILGAGDYILELTTASTLAQDYTIQFFDALGNPVGVSMPIPEPGSFGITLLALGLIGFFAYRRKPDP
jgi:PEP-CTERM motif